MLSCQMFLEADVVIVLAVGIRARPMVKGQMRGCDVRAGLLTGVCDVH